MQDILKYAVLLMGITFFCAFILIVLTLSIWDLGITNPANIGTVGGVSYSHGFWLEVRRLCSSPSKQPPSLSP